MKTEKKEEVYLIDCFTCFYTFHGRKLRAGIEPHEIASFLKYSKIKKQINILGNGKDFHYKKTLKLKVFIYFYPGTSGRMNAFGD